MNVIHYNRYVQFFLYRNVLVMNSNMMHMLPTVHSHYWLKTRSGLQWDKMA